MILVNFKAYREATGEKAGEIAEKIRKAAGRDCQVAVAAQAADIRRLEDVELPVFAQHVDAVDPGSHTGHVLPEAVAEAGASGTIINHSEKRLEPGNMGEAVTRAREAGLATVVCAKSPAECEEFSSLEPDFIAYEPPELIGGDVSVSESKPDMIEEAVERSNVPVLAGAGIKSQADVKKSLERGAEGVLVASAVVKSDEPGEEVEELCSGMN